MPQSPAPSTTIPATELGLSADGDGGHGETDVRRSVGEGTREAVEAPRIGGRHEVAARARGGPPRGPDRACRPSPGAGHRGEEAIAAVPSAVVPPMGRRSR